MKDLLNKFKKREFVQDMVIEFAGDIVMLILGLIMAYYLKIWFFL